MAQCPGSTADGCRCTQHHPGLSEYAHDPEAYLTALKRLVPIELHAVAPTVDNDGCKGGMLCDCPDCTTQRTAATRRQQAARTRQPWEPRPSRHLRAA